VTKYINKQLYKSEVIMEQYFDDKNLYIITKSDGKWTLYNHTENKKICTSKNYINVREKMSE
jgi:hypothetical protein